MAGGLSGILAAFRAGQPSDSLAWRVAASAAKTGKRTDAFVRGLVLGRGRLTPTVQGSVARRPRGTARTEYKFVVGLSANPRGAQASAPKTASPANPRWRTYRVRNHRQLHRQSGPPLWVAANGDRSRAHATRLAISCAANFQAPVWSRQPLERPDAGFRR